MDKPSTGTVDVVRAINPSTGIKKATKSNK